MGLSKKTFIYSTVIAVIIVACTVGYFIGMLPSLYIAYRQEQNYDTTARTQLEYMRTRSLRNQEGGNPLSTFCMEIPLTGDYFFIAGQYFKLRIAAENEQSKTILKAVRKTAAAAEAKEAQAIWDEIDRSDIDGLLSDIFGNNISNDLITSDQSGSPMTDADPGVSSAADAELSAGVTLLEQVNPFDDEALQAATVKWRRVSDTVMALESSITDGINFYTTYMVTGRADDAVIITVTFLLTPQMQELRPVIVRSLPMIIAVSFLLVLVSSQAFSHLIIKPILSLAAHAHMMKEAGPAEFVPLPVTGNDEISHLGKAWNELHEQLADNYRRLAEENRRQEVFLRASSHQLKTPVAAALLLTGGMIDEVGKYKDTRVYLPQVKAQLLSMQKMIDDILYLARTGRHGEIEPVNLSEAVREEIGRNKIILQEKGLTVIQTGERPPIRTDGACLRVMIDNLLSNAIKHTPAGGEINITLHRQSLVIMNQGQAIAAELLPHIFEPFVTGNTNKPDWSGHGLGLYITSYYCRRLGFRLTVENVPGGVEARLIF